MRITRSGFKLHIKRTGVCLAILGLLFSLLQVVNPGAASAKTDSSPPAQQLEIKVGYSGGTYTQVKTFQCSDLEAMTQVRQAYSFIDNMPCPVIDSAVGVKLADILAACGIDVNNVAKFGFWTTDVSGVPYETLTKSYLLDTGRYYFPHLADNWTTDADTMDIAFPDPAAAMADAVQAPTILAIEDNWQREFSTLAPDFSNLTDSTRFRLVFGKTPDLDAVNPEHTASKSAKWVYEIDVTLNGTADTGISLDNPGLNVNPPGLPDEVVLSWTGDPQTTQTISWRTTETAPETVQYLPASCFNGSFTGARTVGATAAFLYTGQYDQYHEEATIEGLTPGTSYVYRVGRDGDWSTAASFTTAGAGNQFSFLYMGDVQNGYTDWGTMVSTHAAVESPGPKFALLGGDLVDDGTSGSQWQQFFDAASPTFKQIPLMPINGNHDDTALFWNSFALPRNGPAAYQEKLYSFDYGNCHIVGLNCNDLTAPGTDSYDAISAWLRNDLDSSNKTWKFVFFHYPPYPVVYDVHAANLQQSWVPLFEQCKVDAVFDAHQHVYMRTYPLKAGQVTTAGDGITYIMGDAGTQYYAPGPAYDYIAQEVAYVSNYEVISIDGDTFTLTAKDANGQVIDSWTMTKQAARAATRIALDKSTAGDGGQLTALYSRTAPPPRS